ncbi:hypothetical protein P5673_011924 [Acropora cervicornis]|uniref:THAP-type domain-containing protein n=1 Tax=Acropora cervicornis TaxID=6130 RepID=A0AAD9V834_ACRCE|nr:hypothetical protein P5673_011924 [Acropora cervicornis]
MHDGIGAPEKNTSFMPFILVSNSINCCPNNGKKLNKWAKQTCTLHACLKGTYTCDCEPPFKLFPFPKEKKDREGRRRWTENIKREIRKGNVWTPKNSSRVCSVHLKMANLQMKIPTQRGFGIQLQLESYKDLRIQELQEQLKEAENELKILKEKLKKVREKNGLQCSDLKTDKEVNLLTGIPTRAAFDALFDLVKKNVKKLRYWTGPVKSTRKGRNFKRSPKKLGPKRELTEKYEFLLTMMKFRLGSVNADLAQRFAVSATT